MEIITNQGITHKLGIQTIILSKNKKLKIDIPSVTEILDFTADKDYEVQISVSMTEKI